MLGAGSSSLQIRMLHNRKQILQPSDPTSGSKGVEPANRPYRQLLLKMRSTADLTNHSVGLLKGACKPISRSRHAHVFSGPQLECNQPQAVNDGSSIFLAAMVPQ